MKVSQLNIQLRGRSAAREGASLQQQIYRQIRADILTGSLTPGEVLPPSRSLADELNVSRNTVLRAYDQLVAEGFAKPKQGAGLFINQVATSGAYPERGRVSGRTRRSTLAQRLKRLPETRFQRTPRGGYRYEFLYGEPSYENFPHSSWARTLGKVAREITTSQLSYPPFQGRSELREAIAGYLKRARRVICNPDNIMIVHGTQDAVDLCCRMLIDPGDQVVCEQPGYRGFIKASVAVGADIRYVPVDDAGLLTTKLPRPDSRSRRAKLAFVTPAHQFPTGGVLPVGRRLALLEWARQHQTMIVEDDYDGEFRYGGPPLDTLHALAQESVVYVGTASKAFFPGLRLGWMVVPEQFIEDLVRLRSIADTTPPVMEQLALAEFMQSGQYERHIFRTRKRYAEKRRRLLAAFEARLGDRVKVLGADAGIHVLLQIPGLPAAATNDLIDRCRDCDVGIHTSAIYYQKPPAFIELVIGYNSVPLHDIPAGVDIIADEILRLLP